MTLHQELTALFRPTELPEADRPRRVETPEDGYFWRRIDFALVLSPSGEVVQVEGPPWRIGHRRRGALRVPSRPRLCPRDLSGFLWGHSAHAFGLARPKHGGAPTVDEAAFNHFRIFHRAVLSGVADPAIRAFLLFLQRWDSAVLDRCSPVYEAVGGTVAFRFQYENDFLHECDAARRIWARQLNPLGSAAEDRGSSDA